MTIGRIGRAISFRLFERSQSITTLRRRILTGTGSVLVVAATIGGMMALDPGHLTLGLPAGFLAALVVAAAPFALAARLRLGRLEVERTLPVCATEGRPFRY